MFRASILELTSHRQRLTAMTLLKDEMKLRWSQNDNNEEVNAANMLRDGCISLLRPTWYALHTTFDHLELEPGQ